jgi:xylulose-5-phosphate/fructose-6-phosphate phosphoketolase
MDEAVEHCRRGLSTWEWASNDEGDPDVVIASAGTISTIEAMAAVELLRNRAPDIKVRFVNVTDLFALSHPEYHSHGLSPEEFARDFTDDRPVLFSFHGYASAVHQMLHRRPNMDRFHVRGYVEEGTTTTPLNLLAMNGVDRFSLAAEALKRADTSMAEQLPTTSGAFAVRAIPDADRIVSELESERDALLATIPERGDDPDEMLEWEWSG